MTLPDLLAATDRADWSGLHHREPLVLEAPRPRSPDEADRAASVLRTAPAVTVLIDDPAEADLVLADAADVCLTDLDDPPRPWVRAEIEAVTAAIAEHAEAALALVALLRTSEPLDVWSAIAAEAATYAMLLGADDHRRWLATRPAPATRPDDDPVGVERDGDVLRIALDRPSTRNAVDRTMRDALVAALDLAGIDTDVTEIHLGGAGPSFSAGGDLGEFGTTTDPAVAFATRLAVHPGAAAHRVADRLTAHLHGHAIGAGIEIPAFAGRVVADPATRIALPELSMGLIPGAGGTASLPRRIGRHRTAWLALTGTTIDATLAHRWALVDELAPPA